METKTTQENSEACAGLAAATGSPVRVQLSRRAGWKMPPNTVVVARPTKWGNPYRVGLDGDARRCVALYENMLTCKTASGELDEGMERFKAEVCLELRGKNLACWCPLESACHADVLLRLANDALCRAAGGNGGAQEKESK